MLKLYKKYYPVLEALLEKHNLEITDTHAHPLEVMNCLGLESFRTVGEDLRELNSRGDSYETAKEGFSDGGFITNLNHRRADLALSKFAFRFLPGEVEKSIRDSYAFIGRKRIGDEMELAHIRRTVLLSVAPFNRIEDIHGLYGNDSRWDYLGSIDIHAMDGKDIEREIVRQKREYPVAGMKLHPNLQGFYPCPEDNSREIADKLDILYRAAEKNGLYILLHGGRSNILPGNRQLRKFPHMLDKPGGHFALPGNLYDRKGRSRLLDKYRCPFVIAHLAHYGIGRPHVKPLVRFYNNYDNLWLETSSVSAGLISQVVARTDAERIIFGSDALYNKQLNELLICIKGIKRGSSPNRIEENCRGILGENYKRLRESLNPSDS